MLMLASIQKPCRRLLSYAICLAALSPFAATAATFDANGVAITELTASPASGLPGADYTVRYAVETNRSVTFVDLAAAVRDSANINNANLDFQHLAKPTTISGKQVFTFTRKFDHADQYKVHVAYTLNGSNWIHVNEPSTVVGVEAPAPFNSDGVAVQNLTVTRGTGSLASQYTATYTIRTNRAVTFRDLAVAVRDSKNVDGPALDFPHPTQPVTVNGTRAFTAQRQLTQPENYTMHVAYTLDGSTWKHVASPSANVNLLPSGPAFNSDGIRVTGLTLTPTQAAPNTDVTVRYTVETNKSVSFSDLTAAVRDSSNVDDSHLDFSHLQTAQTINGSHTFTATRRFDHIDTYNVKIAYTLNGSTWKTVAGVSSSLRVAVPEPTYNEDGVALTSLAVSPNSGPVNGTYQVNYAVKTNKPVTFVDLTAAVRDSSNADNASLDFTHLTAPLTVNGTKSFASARSFNHADQYKVHFAYTLNGQTWKHLQMAPPVTLTVQGSGSGTPTPPSSPGSIRSGLPWNSGSNAHHDYEWKAWETYRNRPNDVVEVFPTRDSWDSIVNSTWYLSNLASFPGKLDIAIPFFPNSGGSLQACASGNYNGYWRQFATHLVAANRGNSYIRPAWEFNGNWFSGSNMNNDPGNWTQCFRQVYTSIKSVAPNTQIAWIMNAHDSKWNVSAWAAYPGDAYVDVVGIDAYDFWPASRNQGEWDAQANGTHGIRTVALFARAHGKKFASPEWGIVHKPYSDCQKHIVGDLSFEGQDNAFFIQKMYELFNEFKDVMAWESYFTDTDICNVDSYLSPPNWNPNASARYKQLFGR